MKLCCLKYCISYLSTLYAQPVTCVIGADKRCFTYSPWLLIFLGVSRHSRHPDFPPSCRSSLTAQMWSAVENTLLPVNVPIRLQLSHREILYLSIDDVTGFCRPSPDFFTRNLLRSPTTGGRVFNLPKKRRGEKFFLHNFSQPRELLSCIFRHVLQKDPPRFYRTVRHGVTFVRIFLHHFGDCKNVSLPFLCLFF